MPNVRSALAFPVPRPPAIADGRGLSFTIGQDAGGCWVALERSGIAGGLFRNRNDALHYAGGEIRHGAGEIRFATGLVAFTVER